MLPETSVNNIPCFNSHKKTSFGKLCLFDRPSFRELAVRSGVVLVLVLVLVMVLPLALALALVGVVVVVVVVEVVVVRSPRESETERKNTGFGKAAPPPQAPKSKQRRDIETDSAATWTSWAPEPVRRTCVPYMFLREWTNSVRWTTGW